MSPLSLRLAHRLIGHAAWIMPPEHRAWARAMRAELDHIPDAFAALGFALGCVQAGYAKRIVAMINVAVMTRWTLAGLALAWAGFSALCTILLVLIKASPNLKPQDLGSDPGTAESLRFIQAYPAWEVGVILATAVLLAAGAVQLVRRRANALPWLVLAVGVATVLTLFDLRLADIGGERPMNSPAALLIPVLCLVPVWWLSRRAPDLKSAT